MKNCILFFIVVTFIVCSCKREEDSLVFKTYGEYETTLKENAEVELNLSSFKHFRELVERIDHLVCNDSIPQITIRKSTVKKRIILRNFCYMRFACVLIKYRNVIEIHNDTIFKQYGSYPLDSLTTIMRRDYFNKGLNNEYCDTPEKLIIQVSYDKEFGNLLNLLDLIARSYDEINPTVSLKVWLVNRVDVLPLSALISSEKF